MPTQAQDFLKKQLNYSRVKEAERTAGPIINAKLQSSGINTQSFQMLIVAYKQELQLDIYLRNSSRDPYTRTLSYPICAASGQLGPKRQMGDGQVPEGFYYINRYNPLSSFHLSLGINYPNTSDRIIGTAHNLGGDIFIHGNCVSIGCLAMGDEAIDQIYLLAIRAHSSGQKEIPVWIFPALPASQIFSRLQETNKAVTGYPNLLTSLAMAWQQLTTIGTLSNITVDQKGNYIVR